MVLFIPNSLNHGVYLLIAFIYNVLISVSRANILDGKMVGEVFARLQIIIGVFMLFRISISILQGIADPDKATDGKTGMGSMIVKIIVSLSLLTLLVPIQYKKPSGQLNQFEKQVSENGILFGTLYDFQDRIVHGNVIAKLILGNTSSGSHKVSQSTIDSSGEELSGVILKSFLTPNLKPGASKNFEMVDGPNGDKRFAEKDLFCKNFENSSFKYDYYYETNNPDVLIGLANLGCQKKGVSDAWYASLIWSTDTDHDDYYAFQFNWFISLIVSVLFLVVLVLLTIEVAKRAIKIAILRLIAPIPIISYMAPKSDFQNGPMGAWVKSLTTTYLELFIQLSVIYFAIFVIMSIRRAGGIEFDQKASGPVWLFAHIFVYLGLILFAKDAPKFLKQALGLKEEGGIFSALKGNFDGLKSIGAGAAGMVGGAVSGAVAAKENNKNVGAGLLKGLGGGTKNAASGIFGGKSSKDMMARNRAYNAQNYANAEDDSSFRGRMKAGFQDKIGLKNDKQKMDDKMKYYNSATDAMNRVTKAFDGNGDYKFKFNGLKDKNGNVIDKIVDKNGQTILKKGDVKSLKDMKDMYNRVQYSGDSKLIEQVDQAMKDAQGDRVDELRSMDRSQIEDNIKYGVDGWSSNDLVAYDSLRRIHDVAQKYQDEPEFTRLGGTEFDDPNTKWGPDWKHDAGQAGKTAEQIKNSDAYSQATANAQRVSQKNDK